ncbi:MAG: GNAT family N-acetyltransferase [Myxococcales bacterium]|nr:GNAT family N-acetyltransferase [Myxococcales bacterium]
MWKPSPLLRPVEALQENIDRVVLRSIEILRSTLGETSELYHVGSTALPPLLTDGTTNILILDEPEKLAQVRAKALVLEELRSLSMPVHLEFADRHKPNVHLRIRHLLATNPIALGEFLALQKRYAHIPGKKYPAAKQDLFSEFLAEAPTTSAHENLFEQGKQQPHVLEILTKRLSLRSPLSIDADDYANYLLANRTSHERFAATSPKKLQCDTWRRIFSAEVMKRYRREALSFLVRKRATDTIIGSCHFSEFIWGRYQQCFVDYDLAEQEEGHGYMTEAVASAVHYVGESWSVHRVQAVHDPRNTKSASLLKRTGFHVEGTMASYVKLGSEWHDCVLAALHW